MALLNVPFYLLECAEEPCYKMTPPYFSSSLPPPVYLLLKHPLFPLIFTDATALYCEDHEDTGL